MPRQSITFEAIENRAGLYHCCICGKNQATLKCSGIAGGPCCLQCAFSMLARLAEQTAEHLACLAS